ncbi:MAG: YceI family protein [Pseudomonadales bacterium]|nr:YceI family protein [Pseudomonadales bacterium]
MRTLCYRAVLTSLSFFIGLPVYAATWVLEPSESKVLFNYSYEGTPYQGEFKNVEAVFNIDPMSPGSCDFMVTIPITDISVDSPEVLDYLHDIELFDVDQFPTASFKAENCRLESLNSFTADGTLTIRDQTHPLSFPFEFEVGMEDGQVRFHLTSEVTIQRLEYGVGQGYWANTSAIPNDVTIAVDVYAVQK